MKNLSWKEEAIAIFKSILVACEQEEDYESCIKLKANIEYLQQATEPVYEVEYPYPFERVEDESSIFIKFSTPLDTKIQKYLGKLEDKDIKPKRRKKK